MTRLQQQKLQNPQGIEEITYGAPSSLQTGSSKDHMMITSSNSEEEGKIPNTVESPENALEVKQIEAPEVEFTEAPIITPKGASIEKSPEQESKMKNQRLLVDPKEDKER